MIRIANLCFEADVDYHAGQDGAEIEARIYGEVDQATVEALKEATLLEDLIVSYGRVIGVRGTYRLCGWRRIENVYNGIKLSWQTYRTTDIEQLKQDNEDLTEALLELAAIIGGEEDG